MKHTIRTKRRLGLAFSVFLTSAALFLPTPHAQAQKQTPEAGPLNFTAKSANVADAGTAVKISVLRWSTDQERKPVVDALDPAVQAAAQAAAAAGGRGGGRGRGGRGGLDPNDPAMADVDATPARGRGGRGGDGAPPKPPDPIVTLTGALGKAPTVGYLWTNEVVGYSIKYAYRMPQRDGGERIVLITDRRLGAGTVGWTPKPGGTLTNYEFTLIEVRIDPKGVGEGKASLMSKVVLDNEAKTLALENYASTPAIFQNVAR